MSNMKTILSLLLVLAVQFVHAQKNTWSLQECINAGLENNIAVKIQKLEVKRTQKSRISILNELLPSISLSGSHSYNFGSTIDPGTNARVSSNILYDNFSMNAQMNLLDFSAIANSQKSKIGIELAKAEQEIIENEYKLQILESFYQALFTQELVEIQKQQFENTRFNLNRITKEIEIGSKPKSDLYDIQFAFAQEEKQLLETIQLFEIQISQLFQLLNYSEAVKTDIKLENTFAEIQSNQSEVIHPKIKWAQLYFKSAKNELKAQQAQKLPLLSTFYQLSSFYYKPLTQSGGTIESFSNQMGNNKNQQLGLQLSIPVFNGFKNNRLVQAAKIDIEKSNLKLEKERLLVQQQLEIESKNEANYLLIKEKLAQMLQLAQASFKTTQAKFASGSVDAFSFSSAKNNLLSSEYAFLKNKLQSQFTVCKIKLIQKNDL